MINQNLKAYIVIEFDDGDGHEMKWEDTILGELSDVDTMINQVIERTGKLGRVIENWAFSAESQMEEEVLSERESFELDHAK